jgi:hypothetical protein
MKLKINIDMNKSKKSPKTISDEEKLKLFHIEELEGRLETAWDDACTTVNNGCTNTGCGDTNDNSCTNVPEIN